MSGCVPCPAPYPPGPVVFNYQTWVAQYPEFAQINSVQAQGYFNMATLYCDNTCNSPVSDNSPGGTRETLLYMLTSHITQLLAAVIVNGQSQAPSPLVGRINNASEGTVSVSTDMPQTPNAAWFNQTKYGAMFWQASAPYRTFRYAPKIPRYLGTGPAAGPFGAPYGWGGWNG